MSKSKGNVIDPLEVIDEYGADALRFTLAAMAAQGRDIKLSAQRVEGYRNFATKLWNAARFAEMNGCVRDPDFTPRDAKEVLNRWIAHETARTGSEVTAAVEAYKFNEAAAAIYRFVWNIFCDWYLELVKPVLTGADGAAKDETRATTAWVLDEIVKLLHPFMPFLTEELWSVTAELGQKREHMLALAAWPQHDGLRRSQSRSRDRLGDRSDCGDPVGACRDERERSAPARHAEGRRSRLGQSAAMVGVHKAVGQNFRGDSGTNAKAGHCPTRGPGRDCGSRIGWHHRPCR